MELLLHLGDQHGVQPELLGGRKVLGASGLDHRGRGLRLVLLEVAFEVLVPRTHGHHHGYPEVNLAMGWGEGGVRAGAGGIYHVVEEETLKPRHAPELGQLCGGSVLVLERGNGG